MDRVLQTVNIATIANYFNVDTRTIHEWVKRGMPRQGRETYCVNACIEWYKDKEVQATLKTYGNKGYVDIEMAKTRKEIADAELREIDVAKARGILINVEDAEKELEKELTPVRNALLGFPRRIAPYMVMCPDETQAQELLDDHIRELMDALSNRVDEPEIEPNDEEEIIEESDETT